MAASADVVIVGGGVMGCSIAYHLALRGIAATVLDRAAPASAPAASWASAGGVRRLGRDGREAPLASAALARWPSLEAELGADLEYRQGGNLKLAESDDDARELARLVERQHGHGFDEAALLDRGEVRALVPGVAPGVVAGAFMPGDGQADPPRTTRAFAAAAERRGARVRSGVDVRGLDVRGGRVAGVRADPGGVAADIVVVAAGAWSGPLLDGAGVRLPIRPEGLQMLRSTPAPAALGPVLSAVRRRLSLKQLPDGAFLVGGGWPATIDAGARACELRAASVEGSWADAADVLPAVGERRIARGWAGLEAMSADGVPFLGPAPGVEGLFVACGFSGHGFALSPAVGAALAGRIVGDAAPELEPLRAGRPVIPPEGW